MLPNYLANIKSSGIYRFVWDKSEMPGQEARILRLVVGYSEKGPFNTPVYVTTESEFKQIFGGKSKKLERYGMWFHRLAIQALKAGPILALNLKNFENPYKEGTDKYNEWEDKGFNKVEFTTFNPNATIFNTDEEAQIAENLKMTVAQLYDTTRFWTLEPEHLEDLGIEGIIPEERQGYITLTTTDSKETSVSVFMRGYEPKGYDVPIAEWYSAVLNGEEVPTYLEGHERDLVSQFFAEIYIFKGEFTPEVAASDKLAKFFNVNGREVTLKPYIINAFGEKVDTLSALAANDASNFIRSYSGILLPEFRNANNTVISLDALVNSDNYIHKLMMRLNQDMLYNIDPDDPDSFQISDIDTSGWYKGPKGLDANSRIMSLMGVEPIIFNATFADGQWNYDQGEHEGEGADYYMFEGLTPTEMDEYKMTFDDKDSRFGAAGIREGDVISIQSGEENVLTHVVKITEEPTETTEPVFTPVDWTLIHNEASWNEAYNNPNSPLRKYEDANPTEDLWNEAEGRAANYNDRKYEGEFNGETVETTKVTWNSDTTQKIEINGVEYYAAIFYGMEPCTVELFSDATLETLVGTFNITNIAYNENCVKCWTGAIKAPGAQYPWVAVNGWNGVLELTIGENTVKPYGEEPMTKEWGVISLPSAFGTDIVPAIDPDNQEATDTFDPSTLTVNCETKKTIKFNIYTVQVDKPLTDIAIDDMEIYKCVSSVTYTSANLKPLYLKGYIYGNSKPESTRQEDKLTWQHYMLDAFKYRGIRQALTNRVDIQYRYLIDTYEGFVEAECKGMLSLICKEKDNTFGILNFPALTSFSKCKYVSFRNEKNEFDTKYIPMGGNPLKPMSCVFTLPSQENGASWVGFFTSLKIRDVDTGIKETVPSAAIVSNEFMKKYSKYLPYTIIAGSNRGVVSEQGLLGPDFNFSREDLDNLEPFGVNCMVYVDRKGTCINSNQTAKQNPVTTLSKIHVRELVIFLQDEIEKLMEDYHWDFNTPNLQQTIKDRADVILETCKNNDGVYEYYNQCDHYNNTDDVINNEMFILSTSIEPTQGAGKMVQELTLYRKGGMKVLLKSDTGA